jgi:hypothetical protein
MREKRAERSSLPLRTWGLCSNFPRKKKAAGPVRARKCPLALSGLQKNGSRWPVPVCTFAPHASGMPSSDREDSTLHLTIFIRWGVEPVYMTLLVLMQNRRTMQGTQHGNGRRVEVHWRSSRCLRRPGHANRRGLTCMRPPCVKRQIAPKSGLSRFSAVQVLAPSAGGCGC